MNQVSVNVAPQSTKGHFVKGEVQVVNLDEVNETFVVKGKSVLETENHTTLKMEKSCLITIQQVVNPFTQMFERSKD